MSTGRSARVVSGHNAERPRSYTLDKTQLYDHACRVAIAIVAYFRRHPDAKDNLEGIALWWVDDDQEVVEKGLSLLVELGVVKEDHDLYSLAQEAADESVENRLEEVRKKLTG